MYHIFYTFFILVLYFFILFIFFLQFLKIFSFSIAWACSLRDLENQILPASCHGWLTGWLAAGLAGWLAGWRTGWLSGCLASLRCYLGCVADWHYWMAGWLASWPADKSMRLHGCITRMPSLVYPPWLLLDYLQNTFSSLSEHSRSPLRLI